MAQGDEDRGSDAAASGKTNLVDTPIIRIRTHGKHTMKEPFLRPHGRVFGIF
jgi:hypothetical protein